ncbi:FAD dependent oxidoreductase [Mycena metata]|uniref:FAD dependent oxidoreductase n=1 Tax=Mycena metata TaxID=1033252 RepID=A0AAD7JEN6_9AGAR|nr:FAD dependent oxidoreductase [Mycena metata]
MTRFNTVKYDKPSGTIAIGPVIAAGGRVPGPGVAGFSLGGGFNWLSNTVGLTVDTILGYQLVKPNGDIVSVTQTSNPDLFFALKGIVTQFTFKAFPVGQVWGGLLTYGAAQTAEFNAAFANFAVNNTDPKAEIVAGYVLDTSRNPLVANIMFYNGPTPPAGVFDKFLAIKNASSDISTRSFLSLVEGYFNTLSFFEYTLPIVNAILNETTCWGARLAAYPNATAQYHMEPFLKTFLTHNTTATAWPFYRTTKFLQFTWSDPKDDTIMRGFMEQSAAHLTSVANQNGQAIQQLPLYPNCSIYGTIQAQVDPQDVMGLAGGWKV